MEMFRIQFGAVPWDQMTVERIEGWLKTRRQQVRDDTVRRDLALLSAVMETAIVSWGLPGKNLAQIAGTRLTKGRTMQQKVQRSVYGRILNGVDAEKKHLTRLTINLPPAGSVRCMTITEKQYAGMIFLVGKPAFQEKMVTPTQLLLF